MSVDPAVLLVLGKVQRRLQQLAHVDDATIVRIVRNWIGTAESGSLFMAAGDEGAMIVVGLGLLALWLSMDSTDGPGVQVPPVVVPPVSGGGGTPTPPDPPVPPVVGPPVTSSSGDQIDPRSIQVVNTFDFRGYQIAGKITRVVVSPNNVQIFSEGVEGNWPGIYPDGFADPINFTVGLVLNIGGQWVASGFIQGNDAYHGSEGVGDGIADFPRNWYYSDRWSPMTGHEIQPGEQIGLFLMGGNGRDGGGPEVAIRTQIVVIPATSDGVFTF